MTQPTNPSRVLRELLETAAELNACGLVPDVDLARLQVLATGTPPAPPAFPPAPASVGKTAPEESGHGPAAEAPAGKAASGPRGR